MTDSNPLPSAGPENLANNRKQIWAWAMYDWACSAYSTMSITVLVYYITQMVLTGKTGVMVWGYGIGIMGLIVAVLSPTLGAWADSHGSKRKWLAGTAWLGAGATALMFFATPDKPWLLVILFLLAQFGMELSQTFYNGFLPEIATPEELDRVSGYGYALGYVGGGLALLIILGLSHYSEQLGFSEFDSSFLPRLGLLITGLWWAVFTIPTIFYLQDRRRADTTKPQSSIFAAGRSAIKEVLTTLRHIRKYQMLTIFLIGFLFYNDGVQTVISQASVFGTEALKMGLSELTLMILMIQFVAAVGAIVISKISDRFGAKLALNLCLAIWVSILIAAYFVETQRTFWILGVFVALVLGGTQSVSRSIMALMTPPDRTAEFFGFFNLSGKAISVLGPIVFSTTLAVTGSPYYAILSLLGFFIIGWAFIARLNIAKGREQALMDHR